MPKTKVKGIFVVYEKLKAALNEEYSISVGATELKSDSFTEIEECVNKALDDALTISDSIIIANNINAKPQTENWLEKINANQKNFKLVVEPKDISNEILQNDSILNKIVNGEHGSEVKAPQENKGNKQINLDDELPGFNPSNIQPKENSHPDSKNLTQDKSLDKDSLIKNK